MKILKELYLYEEKMLKVQFEMSNIISHALTKGEVREEYIKDFVKRKVKNIRIEKGILINGEDESSQQDFIVCSANSVIHNFGTHAIVEAKDCKNVFEIKSKIKTEYLRELNFNAEKIKQMNKNIRIGLIGYEIDVQEKTILKKFGYIYDKDIDGYSFHRDLIYKEIELIDYVISLSENAEFIIVKNEQDYVLIKEKPILKYFIDLLNGE